MMVIHKENIEEYLLLLIDGELSAAEEMEVMIFVESHPEYQQLLDQFLDTKMEDETMVFEDKQSLLKPEAPNVLPFNNRKKIVLWAAALAAVISAGVAFELFNNREATMPLPLAQQSTVTVSKVDTTGKQPLVTIVKPLVPNEKKAGTIIPKKETKILSPHQNAMAVQMPIAEQKRNIDALKPLPETGLKTLEIKTSTVAVNEEVAVSREISAEETSNTSNNGLPDASRLDGVNALIAQVETLKENVEAKSKIFKNMTVAIRLGGKEFTIGK